jgi:hypothetical protein
MHRRELVRLLGVGVAGLAGCGTFGDDDSPPPTPSDGDSDTPGSTPEANPVYPFDAGAAADFEFEESDSGTVIIRVPVENTRAEPYSGTMTMVVDVGDGERTLTTSIQLAGNESTMVAVELDTDWDDWTRNFGSVQFSQGTPVDEE